MPEQNAYEAHTAVWDFRYDSEESATMGGVIIDPNSPARTSGLWPADKSQIAIDYMEEASIEESVTANWGEEAIIGLMFGLLVPFMVNDRN